MQGQLIIGAILVTAFFGSVPAAAVDQPQRQTCSKGQQPQPVPQTQQRQQKQTEQAQQRARSQGCPVTRSIPSVVDPTPTFLL